MLSYRHAFHIGNHADVLKHLVLFLVLKHLNKKDKAYQYIDTHSGAGMYSLSDDFVQKKQEYIDGIGRLWNSKDLPPLLQEFVAHIDQVTEQAPRASYPGSPMLTASMLRPQDSATLFELHPKDFDLLRQQFPGRRKIKVRKEDGYKGLISLLPPPSRRGVVLIDPPYEIKDDYQRVVEVLVEAYKRFATGTYLLWYPVVDRSRIDAIESALTESGIRNIELFELAIKADSEGFGMTASGMIAINPPWTLAEELGQCGNILVDLLSQGDGANFRHRMIAPE